jgi:hypothetical protein
MLFSLFVRCPAGSADAPMTNQLCHVSLPSLLCFFWVFFFRVLRHILNKNTEDFLEESLSSVLGMHRCLQQKKMEFLGEPDKILAF